LSIQPLHDLGPAFLPGFALHLKRADSLAVGRYPRFILLAFCEEWLQPTILDEKIA